MEAINSPKQTIVESIQHPIQQPTSPVVDGPAMSSNERRAAFDNIMGDMHSQFSSNDVAPKFNPNGTVPGGDLPQGTVDMEQIVGLMSGK